MNLETLPKVSIIIANSRDNKWFEDAKKSALNQYYPHIELIIEDNLDNSRNIGKCWNDGVRNATGEYCLIMGDDDIIAPSYIMSLISTILNTRAKGDMVDGSTSCTTVFEDDLENGKMKHVPTFPTGIFNREFLLNNPFDETLKKRVDAYYYESLPQQQLAIAFWDFGYFYRQHKGMVSGNNRFNI